MSKKDKSSGWYYGKPEEKEEAAKLHGKAKRNHKIHIEKENAALIEHARFVKRNGSIGDIFTGDIY